MSDIGESVLDFYGDLPFNMWHTADAEADAIRAHSVVDDIYPVLARELAPGKEVVEIGCGTGWLSNSIAHHHGCRVTGVDFNPVATARASRVASLLSSGARFATSDIFEFFPERKAEVVVSIGVLHHTRDCHAAITHVVGNVLAPGGAFFLGLYHLHGRAPFLEHFAAMRNAGATLDEMRGEYARIHPAVANDPVHLESWFRDQVLHPHETQHTLEEVIQLTAPLGLELDCSSVNNWRPFADMSELFELETQMRTKGVTAIQDGRYYPGFFVSLFRKAAIT